MIAIEQLKIVVMVFGFVGQAFIAFEALRFTNGFTVPESFLLAGGSTGALAFVLLVEPVVFPHLVQFAYGMLLFLVADSLRDDINDDEG